MYVLILTEEKAMHTDMLAIGRAELVWNSFLHWVKSELFVTTL